MNTLSSMDEDKDLESSDEAIGIQLSKINKIIGKVDEKLNA